MTMKEKTMLSFLCSAGGCNKSNKSNKSNKRSFSSSSPSPSSSALSSPTSSSSPSTPSFRHIGVALIYLSAKTCLANESPSPCFYSANNNDPATTPTWPVRIPGWKFEEDGDFIDNSSDSWRGFGREFDLFDTRRGGGAAASKSTSRSSSVGAATPTRRKIPHGYYDEGDENDVSDGNDAAGSIGDTGTDADIHTATPDFGSAGRSSWLKSRSNVVNNRPRGGGGSGSSRGGSLPVAGATSSRFGGTKFRSGDYYAGSGGSSWNRPYVFQTARDWWTATMTRNLKNWPKIQCRVEPTTTLKIRKTFRPLKTIFQIGADFNTQLGVWQFKSSWEDAIIGGKLTWVGRELQLTKSWQISVGAVEDLVTRLRFRAAVDLHTWKAYARVGFRTERLSPINVVEGFTILKQLPLDGNSGHVKLEVRANFALPEPEIEYSTESQHRSMVGMGDIEVNIDELNLLLDY